MHTIHSFSEKFLLKVKLFRRKILEFIVNPDNTIIDIKHKIQQKRRLLPEHQVLFFGGLALEDDRTLEDYAIKTDATLDLFLQGMFICLLAYLFKLLILVITFELPYHKRY